MRHAVLTLAGGVALFWQCAAMAVHIDPVMPPVAVTRAARVPVQVPPVHHPDVTRVQPPVVVPTPEDPSPPPVERPPLDQDPQPLPPPEPEPPPPPRPDGNHGGGIQVPDVLHKVPNVVGRQGQDAENAITAKGYVPIHSGAERSTRKAGTVTRQSPAAGSWRLEGAKVAYWVSAGNVIPEIRGRSAEDANTILREAGYAMGTRTLRESAGNAGVVLTQSPKAGTEADPGTLVNVDIAANPTYVVVPNLVNSKENAALEKLQQVGLTGALAARKDAAKSKGQVVAQTPAPGTRAKRGSPVRYDVASGFNRVPALKGSSDRSARATLKRAGFQLGAKTQQPGAKPTNQVADQSPRPGSRLELGESVDIVMGAGPVDTVAVPDILDRSEADAISLLRSAKLEPSREGDKNSPRQRGHVVEADPPPGTQVAVGSVVRYWSASGENNVPDVTGLTADTAKLRLDGAGFSIGKVDTRVDAIDAVVTQSPVSGSVAPVGSPIDIVVGTGSGAVDISNLRVPNVLGKSEDDAKNLIAAANLAVGVIKTEYNMGSATGVIAQAPGAGTSVPTDGAPPIALTISKSLLVPVIAGSSLLALAAAGTWWIRYRPYPFNWPPTLNPNIDIDLEDGDASERHFPESTPRDVRIRVELEDGDSPPPTELSAKRKETRYD